MAFCGNMRLRSTLISMAITGSILSVAYLNLAATPPTAEETWTQVQKQQQTRVAGTSEIRYLCVNQMAFALDRTGSKLSWNEDKIVVADEEAKRRCRLPGMPTFRGPITSMSAVSPADGYGAAFITTNDDPARVIQSLKRAGWRESEASRRLRRPVAGYRGHYFMQSGAWMLVLLKTAEESNRTTAILAGQWDPGTMEQQ